MYSFKPPCAKNSIYGLRLCIVTLYLSIILKKKKKLFIQIINLLTCNILKTIIFYITEDYLSYL